MQKKEEIAYFSMEVGIDSRIPTYSGGLGILAGDTLRSCADIGAPIVGITLMNNKGYFFQKLDDQGNQIEIPVEWSIDDFMELENINISIPVEGRKIKVQVWKYLVTGITGCQIPIYFLDTNVKENSEYDREITYFLYGGDEKYRLYQEIILGIGGVLVLDALGYKNIKKYHMNEGHSSLLVLELIKKENEKFGDRTTEEIIRSVRNKCIFTTHTPIQSAHDKFSISLVKEVLGGYIGNNEIDKICQNGVLNMTLLALNNSLYINGVSKKQQKVSSSMFPGYPIDSISNGVHHIFWTSKSFRKLFDKYASNWRVDPSYLRHATLVPRREIMDAHLKSKRELLDFVNTKKNIGMDIDIFTIGFARRITKYKRFDLLFNDIEKLKDIALNTFPIQIILAGKSHPKDFDGKRTIKNIYNIINDLSDHIKIVFLENYDIEIAKLITSGVDVWLNTPQVPNEASGTSGMKASLNGVPSLSILDGWWIDGHIEDVTGWKIESAPIKNVAADTNNFIGSNSIYSKLESVILPMFYSNKKKWTKIMRYTISFNGSFFNSKRMLQQYMLKAYSI